MLCAVTLGLLCVSALVSGAETSFFSLSHNDIRRLRKRTTASAEAVLRLLTNVDLLLATILVVNNLVNICIVILTSSIIDSVFTFLRFEFLFKTVLVTFLLLLFGEILPKVLAQTIPVRFAAMVAARPLAVLRWLFYPLSYMRWCGRAAASARRLRPQERDLAGRAGRRGGHDPELESRGACDAVGDRQFRQYRGAGDHEAPRGHHGARHATDDYETVKKTIIESGFSRIPVYEEDIDNIQRHALRQGPAALHQPRQRRYGWQQLVRKPYFVPEHKKINDLLADFQSNKVHMAIVVDEYGSTLGLVSLEDIIEEIVGEISDESDADESFLSRGSIAKCYVIFEGKSHLGRLRTGAGASDEETFADVRGEAETLAGLMLELKRDFPRKGDVFTSHDLRFTVQEMDGHRIDKIRVDHAGNDPEEAAASSRR